MHITTRPHAPSALLLSHPDPAGDYAAALTKWEGLRQLDGAAVNAVCRSQLLTHGTRTEHAVVLVHGISNCPAQYARLAPLFFEQGYNVLIPRIPWNGLLDRSGEDLRHLTAEELRAFSDTIVDIACGLGEQVTVAGLSGGGVVACWVAQCRPEVERAVAIAPSIGLVPALPFGNLFVNWLGMRLGRLLPNIMTQRFMPITSGPNYAYVGFATRGLSAMMELGFAVLAGAKAMAPAAASIQVVLNENDGAINAPVARELTRRWRATAGNRVRVYTIQRARGIIHDLIDPNQLAQQTEVIYPALLDLIIEPRAQPAGAAP